MKSRARKKAAPAPAVSEIPSEAVNEAAPAPVPDEPAAPGPKRNVSSLESGLSLAAGVLFLVSALFPRSIKQLLLLGMGGWLTYRGMTGRCDLYGVLGIDTEKGRCSSKSTISTSLKYLAAGVRKPGRAGCP